MDNEEKETEVKRGAEVKKKKRGNPRGNPQNLTPLTKRTPEEARAIRSAGGKANKKKFDEQRYMKDQLKLLLSLPNHSKKLKKKLEEMGIDSGNNNNQMALLLALYQKALGGDVSAFNSIRDTSGQKPIDQLEANVTASSDKLNDILKQLKENE